MKKTLAFSLAIIGLGVVSLSQAAPPLCPSLPASGLFLYGTPMPWGGDVMLGLKSNPNQVWVSGYIMVKGPVSNTEAQLIAEATFATAKPIGSAYLSSGEYSCSYNSGLSGNWNYQNVPSQVETIFIEGLAISTSAN